MCGRRGEILKEVYSEIVADGEKRFMSGGRSINLRLSLCIETAGSSHTVRPARSVLRQKDVVATFNWDPFLIQAKRRNPMLSGTDHNYFSCTASSGPFCETDSCAGPVGSACERCGTTVPSRLLYPIKEKDYDSDPMIAVNWKGSRRFGSHSSSPCLGTAHRPRTSRRFGCLKKAWATRRRRTESDRDYRHTFSVLGYDAGAIYRNPQLPLENPFEF